MVNFGQQIVIVVLGYIVTVRYYNPLIIENLSTELFTMIILENRVYGRPTLIQSTGLLLSIENFVFFFVFLTVNIRILCKIFHNSFFNRDACAPKNFL